MKIYYYIDTLNILITTVLCEYVWRCSFYLFAQRIDNNIDSSDTNNSQVSSSSNNSSSNNSYIRENKMGIASNHWWFTHRQLTATRSLFIHNELLFSCSFFFPPPSPSYISATRSYTSRDVFDIYLLFIFFIPEMNAFDVSICFTCGFVIHWGI